MINTVSDIVFAQNIGWGFQDRIAVLRDRNADQDRAVHVVGAGVG